MQDAFNGEPMAGSGLALLDVAGACCLILDEKSCQVNYRGIEAGLLSAGRSPDFTAALLDIGLISLHLGAPGILDTIALPRSKTTVAVLLDYAVDIAPRIPESPTVIDGAAVIEKARDMRSRYTDPATDPELVRTIGVISQLAIDGMIALKPKDFYPEDEARER